MAKKKIVKDEIQELQNEVENEETNNSKTLEPSDGKNLNLLAILKSASKTKELKELFDESIINIQDDTATTTEFISTNIAIFNLAFSGRIKLKIKEGDNWVVKNGGIPIGKATLFSSPSMFGKSFIAMYIIKNALKLGMSVIYLDAEDSFSYDTAKKLNIETNSEKLQVIVNNSLEDIRTIIMTTVNEIPKKDRKKLLFIIDSWNVLTTSKCVNDAISGEDKKDMTVPIKKNELANLILGTRATFFILNHIYDDTSGAAFQDFKVPGGRRIVHNCQSSLLGKSSCKYTPTGDKTDVRGHIITARIHKSRYGKNQIDVKYLIKTDGGIDPFFGLLDDAIEGGYVVIDGKRYVRPCVKDDKPWWLKDIYCSEFWKPIFTETDFYDWIALQYQHSSSLDVMTEEQTISELM